MDYIFNTGNLAYNCFNNSLKLGDVSFGTIFEYGNRRYVKLFDTSDKHALAITVDPLFSVSATFKNITGHLYYHIFNKLLNWKNTIGVKEIWVPTEDDYLEHSHMFKDYFKDQWYVAFDDDNTFQDQPGAYMYVDDHGVLKDDSAINRSKDWYRQLNIRAMCYIDSNKIVAVSDDADSVRKKTINQTYDLSRIKKMNLGMPW